MAGLKAAEALPVGHGYAQLTATVTKATGIVAQAEAGFRPIAPLALFAFGSAPVLDVSRAVAGAGVRWTF